MTETNVKYDPFSKGGWNYGERFYHSTKHGDYHHYLGPCPKCGTVCFDYGGGWRCLNYDCNNSANNPVSNLGPRPDWWNTNILVKMDGNAWCAHYTDFVDLQESKAGFGGTPDEAIKNLKAVA